MPHGNDKTKRAAGADPQTERERERERKRKKANAAVNKMIRKAAGREV